MSVELVTFDAAQTIVRVEWSPREFTILCAQAVGLEVDRDIAGDAFQGLLATRWKDYEAINTTRDISRCEAFWRELTSDWLDRIGMGAACLDRLIAYADSTMYARDSGIFQPYPDTVPALEALRTAGLRLAVISNWDFSLHRVLRVHDLAAFFELEIASLEEGIEKPDSRLFHMALGKLAVRPENALHVGDDPYDDVLGATQAGMRALLIDRSLAAPIPGVITSLQQIPEAIQWIG